MLLLYFPLGGTKILSVSKNIYPAMHSIIEEREKLIQNCTVSNVCWT